eukprot:scaffold5126_cov190-Amphora_coffeaeformis.AAC.5
MTTQILNTDDSSSSFGCQQGLPKVYYMFQLFPTFSPRIKPKTGLKDVVEYIPTRGKPIKQYIFVALSDQTFTINGLTTTLYNNNNNYYYYYYYVSTLHGPQLTILVEVSFPIWAHDRWIDRLFPWLPSIPLFQKRFVTKYPHPYRIGQLRNATAENHPELVDQRAQVGMNGKLDAFVVGTLLPATVVVQIDIGLNTTVGWEWLGHDHTKGKGQSTSSLDHGDLALGTAASHQGK